MSSMTDAFDTAAQAMASLRLFRDHHASTAPYQEHKAQVVAMLRQRAGKGDTGA